MSHVRDGTARCLAALVAAAVQTPGNYLVQTPGNYMIGRRSSKCAVRLLAPDIAPTGASVCESGRRSGGICHPGSGMFERRGLTLLRTTDAEPPVNGADYGPSE